MNAKTKEHPADGIYYVDYRMLIRRSACLKQRARWREFYGLKRTKITMGVLRNMHKPFNHTLLWAANVMCSRGAITYAEYLKFSNDYGAIALESFGAEYFEPQRIAFMDLLAARARREGRLL